MFTVAIPPPTWWGLRNPIFATTVCPMFVYESRVLGRMLWATKINKTWDYNGIPIVLYDGWDFETGSRGVFNRLKISSNVAVRSNRTIVDLLDMYEPEQGSSVRQFYVNDLKTARKIAKLLNQYYTANNKERLSLESLDNYSGSDPTIVEAVDTYNEWKALYFARGQ